MGEDGLDPDGRPVLGTLLAPSRDTQARELSFALARAADAPVRLLAPSRAPESFATASTNGPPVSVSTAEAVADAGHSAASVVREEVTDARADTVVVQRPPTESPGPGIRRGTTDRIVAASPVDTVVANGCGDLDGLASILVPVAGGPHTELTVRVARALAEHTDAWIELFTVIPENPTAEERSRGAEHLAAARRLLDGYEAFDTWCYEAADPAAAIAEQAAYYDAVVLGAPTKSRLERLVFGSTPDSVDERVDVPVVTAASK